MDCEIFIAPSNSSVFVRNTDKCKLIIACGQLRTRECNNLHILLFCQTYPVIESSNNIQFGCFQFCYPELRSQFDSAGLDVWNNNWSEIYDFTPTQPNAPQQPKSKSNLIDLSSSSQSQNLGQGSGPKNYSYLPDDLDLT